MKKSITVSIPKPCHEKWNEMTPTQKGRHCAVCTKEVIDFTTLTDEAIVKHAMQNKNMCGRFKKTQLNRPLTLQRASGKSLAPLAASFLLPLSLLATNHTNPEKSISKQPFHSINIDNVPNHNRIQVTYQGVITNSQGAPINNVKVEVVETGQTKFSDKNGNYKITFLDRDTLKFSALGFETFKLKASHFSETKNITLALEQDITKGKIKPSETINIRGNITIENNSVNQKKEPSTTLITITGNITDNSGIPLPGANIIIKGTSNGTQTDFDGNYSISAKKGSTIVYSYIGFETQEIELRNNVINVTLDEGPALGGIVVVGYYNQDISNDVLGYPRNTYHDDAEREAKVTKRKAAYKQTRKFKQIQIERKKAARKVKRALRKRKNKLNP